MTTSSSVEFVPVSKLRFEYNQILKKLGMDRSLLERKAKTFTLTEEQRSLYERLTGLEWIIEEK